LLYLLDISDNIPYINLSCVDNFYYKINDKINDLLSYLLVYLFFPLNKIFLIFIIYRAIGVLLFAITKKSIWFTIMPDLFKEYLIYVHIFKSNNNYLPILISCKMLFEYKLHGNYKIMT